MNSVHLFYDESYDREFGHAVYQLGEDRQSLENDETKWNVAKVTHVSESRDLPDRMLAKYPTIRYIGVGHYVFSRRTNSLRNQLR